MPAVTDYPAISQISIVPIDTADFGPGVSYQVDTSFEAYRRQSTRHTTIPSQRESINLEGKTGEGTVNSEGLWRVNAPDWSYGAGQLYADRAGSVANRFLASTGVDVFTTQYQASLLQATTQRRSTVGGAAAFIATIGPYVFWTEDTAVYWVTAWGGTPNAQAMTGSDFAGGEIILGLMHDDANIYIGTTKALYQCQVFSGSTPPAATKVISQGCICVGAAGGRIFVSGWANQNHLYDVTAAANPTTPPALPTDFNGGLIAIHANPKWVWSGVALVGGIFYFIGIPVDNDSALIPNSTGEIWMTAFQAANQTGLQGVGLPTPQIALTLPPGEVCNTIFAYGNLCLLGTTRGVRVCRTVSMNDPEGNSGDLIAGPILPNLLQPVGGWVTGFTANGRFVWFTWSGYNDTFVGGSINNTNSDNASACVLGRLDMETMVDTLQPAYAADLVFNAGTGGYMWALAWDPITSGPVLAIYLAAGGTGSTNGLWTIDPDNVVASGFIDSGLVTNNIPDDKIAAMISERSLGSGTVSFNAQSNGLGYSALGPIAPTTPSTTPELLNPLVRYEEMNVSVVLTKGTGNQTPLLKRWTLKSIPAVVSGTTISVVAMLYSRVESHNVQRAVNPYVELNYLEGLRLSQQPCIYTEGDPNGKYYQATVTIDSLDWLPEHERDTQQHGWDGVCVVYMKAIVG